MRGILLWRRSAGGGSGDPKYRRESRKRGASALNREAGNRNGTAGKRAGIFWEDKGTGTGRGTEDCHTSEGKNAIQSAGGILTNTTATTTLDDLIAKYPVLSGTDKVEIRTCGSTSVEKVVTALIDKFLGAIPNKNINIPMNQTGSGDAIPGVTEGKNGVISDLGFLSREIKDDELAQLNDNNKHGIMCKDAVVAIVNAANTAISDATPETLTSIYKGEVKTWAELVK